MNPRLVCFSLMIWGAAIFTACQPAPASQRLTIAAAASLNNAFNEIGSAFTAQTGIPVTFSYAATGTLAEQIRNGAPFDIFAAADTTRIHELATQGFITSESQVVFAYGEVSLVIAPDSGMDIQSLNDLSSNPIDRFTIANPKIAPYGSAAQAILENAGLWTQLEEQLVFGESVRQSLQYIESGEIPAGILPNSLLQNSTLTIISLDRARYEPVAHGAGILAESPNTPQADQFIQFLFSPQGQAILAQHGLTPISTP
ncbi:MAG: molybdate ABC transporter substrate-binding protein [Chloroflexi bacterium]|jgi:molybdate transport system substrate-binding protein|nr:molybdate ABC transporter substrate-binding protein [Chloroflexota bacterium]